MKKFLLYLFLIVIITSKSYSAYLSENFESPFVGSPPAPPGWSQIQIRTIQNVSDEQDWMQNVWNGSSWSILSTGNNTNTLGAKSGSGVLWIDDYNYMRTTNAVNARRMISPLINLSSSTSPFLRFWYFNSQAVGQSLNVRVLFSSDGGAVWNQVAPILNGWDSSANRWNRINIPIPPSYRTSNFKIAFEITNRYGASNPFIDLVTVEEFIPTTITSTAAGGSWLNPAAWVGGVVPTSDNNVVISAGANVTINSITGLIARCQDLQINGTLRASATNTSAIYAVGNITVSSTGRLISYSGTSGRTVMCGGNFINQGIVNFGVANTTTNNYTSTGLNVGASTLVMFGAGGTTFQNTGALDSNRINNFWLLSGGTVTINSTLTVPLTLGLYDGVIAHSGNLVLGNAGANNQVQTIERHRGALQGEPLWDDARIASRNNTYITTNFARVEPANITLGDEIYSSFRPKTVTGVLRLETFNNLFLAYPLNVGTTTTGGLTLNRGILATDSKNILRTSSFFAPPTGTAPTTIFPSSSATQGSYIYGPIQVDFPVSSSSRSFPIGYGNQPVGSSANSNKLLTFALATTTAWSAGTSITVTVTGKPTGSVVSPLTLVMGTRSYNISINEGPDLPVNAYISGLRANNYVFGDGSGSDSLLGNRQNLYIAQSPSVTGPWTSRSIASGTGAIVNNTDYPRNTSVSSPGPISPILTKGGYLAWATNASINADASIISISPSGSVFYPGGTTSLPMAGIVKNTGLVATTSNIFVTRKIFGTAYQSSATVPAGLGVGASADISFADFTGFVSGTNYTIKDSVYLASDPNVSNDTLTSYFSPNISKNILIIWDDPESKDSLINHINSSSYANYYDVVSTVSFLPNISLSNWKTIFVLYGSSHGFSSITNSRDSLKVWLDGANNTQNKRTLCIFGNDLGSQADPRANAGATAADTIFYRKYLRAQFWADNWLTSSPGSDGKFKGTSPYFNSITSDSLYDPYPDAIAPASWNGGLAAFLPISNNAGDTACATYYIGTYYNMFYGSNSYSSYKSRASVLNYNPINIFNEIINFLQINNGVAPVELSSFTSFIDKRNVTLRWRTNNEENNAGFDIERKISGTKEWAKVGNVAGAGNSNTVKSYKFEERNLATARYQYRLKQMDFNGNYKYYDLAGEVIIGVPSKFDISQNYPNPFNPSTKINYDLPFDSKVQIKIFDITGREMYQLVNETKTAGYYTAQFNAVNLASGVYFYMINANGGNQSYVKTMKMVLVK